MTVSAPVLATDVAEVAEQMWSSVAGLEALAIPGLDALDIAVSGTVQIAGGWNGAVIVSMTPALASTVTSQMFDMSIDELEQSDLVDAVGEVANMIGGNIKAMLPGPSQLSLPTVVDGGPVPMVPGGQVVQQVGMLVDGQPFDVTVVEAEDRRPGATSHDSGEGADR